MQWSSSHPIADSPSAATAPGQADFTQHWFNIFAWVYAFTLTLLSRIWTIKYPGPADAELFAYIGREWSNGVIPYKQIWDNKPPGIFAVNALAAITHRQAIALALFELVALFATYVLISFILAELGCSAFARWTAPFVAASILTIPYYSPGGDLTEIYLLPFAACCIYCFLRALRGANPSFAWLILSGIAAGFAGTFKPVGIASLLAITVFCLFDRIRSLRSRIIALTFPWVGACLIWAVTEGYFALHGAARQMANASLFYNLHYGAAAQYSFPQSILLMVDRLSTIEALLGCAAAWLLFWLWPKVSSSVPAFFTDRQRNSDLLLFLWLGADLCGARAGGRYYPHYFLPSLLSFVVIACVAIDVIVKMTSPIRYYSVFIYILLIPIGVTALKGQLDFYHSASGNPPAEWTKAGLYIKTHKSPSDTIFTWEFRPGIYRLAESHTLTRWDSAHYIDDFPEAYQSIGPELITELQTAPPKFIVDDCSQSPPGPHDTVRTQFLDLLARQYYLVYQPGGTCVFEHR
jgi:hypothetical protein